MYATIAYVDRNTARDDVSFHVSKKYDSSSMWDYVKQVCRHAERNSVRLLDITVFDGGEEVWNWREQSSFSSAPRHFKGIPSWGSALCI